MPDAGKRDEHFEALLEHLRESRGLDFSGYKRSTLTRRITRRMQLGNIEGFDQPESPGGPDHHARWGRRADPAGRPDPVPGRSGHAAGGPRGHLPRRGRHLRRHDQVPPGPVRPPAHLPGAGDGVRGAAVHQRGARETTNEELQSVNEEHETINEELQSTNDELKTLNEQLRGRTEALKDANLLLETILGGLAAAAVAVDPNLSILLWNSKAQDLWGLRVDEVHGKSFVKLEIGVPVTELLEPLRACLTGPTKAREQVLAATDRRGRAIRCRVSVNPLARDGEIRGAVMLMEEERG